MSEVQTKNVVIRLDGAAHEIYQFLLEHNDKIKSHQAAFIRDAAVQGMLEAMNFHIQDVMNSVSDNDPKISKTDALETVLKATQLLAKIMIERKQIHKTLGMDKEGGELL